MRDNYENTVPDEILERITRGHFSITTLATSRANRLDFH